MINDDKQKKCTRKKYSHTHTHTHTHTHADDINKITIKRKPYGYNTNLKKCSDRRIDA